MYTLKKRAKYLVESLTGYDIERCGPKSFVFIDKANRPGAWFSYRAQLKSIFERFKIDLVLDVGANEGQFAKKLRAFYAGEILSFEPVSASFGKLAAAALPDPHWRAYNIALGSSDTTQTIHVADNTVFSSLLKSNEYSRRRFGDDAQGKREEVVSVRRLDKLLQESVPALKARRIYLKMDTQGYDSEVFKGLGDASQHVCALQSEVSLISIYDGMPHWTETIAAYEQAGFGVVGMFPVSRDAGRVVEYDCLLARAAP